MKRTDILYFIGVSPTKVGGVELFARELGRVLERREVTITFCFCTPPDEYVQRLFEGPNVRVMHMEEQTAVSLSSIRALWRVIRSLRPETVVYCFGGIVRPLPWICKVAGVERVIYNDHASRVAGDDDGGPVKRSLERLITAPVDSVIAVSDFIAFRNRRERLHSAPVHAVPNGIDLSRRKHAATRHAFLDQHGIPPDRRIVSQLSSLINEKGIDTLLRAAADILRRRSDVHFVIGGEGPRREEYERLANELAISDHVTFAGKISDPVLSGLYVASDVFCLASRWAEACGLVLLEGMSFEVPVVATRVGGIPEFVRDGIDGFLVDGEPVAFANAVCALLENESRRRKMGAEGRARVEREFNVSLMAERYAELLVGPTGVEQQTFKAGAR